MQVIYYNAKCLYHFFLHPGVIKQVAFYIDKSEMKVTLSGGGEWIKQMFVFAKRLSHPSFQQVALCGVREFFFADRK